MVLEIYRKDFGKNGVRNCLPVACLSVLSDRQPYCHTNATSIPCWRTTKFCAAIACQYIVGASRRGDIVLWCRSPRKCRQSLASTLSAPRVAATSYCDPGRHANVVTPCLNVPNKCPLKSPKLYSARPFTRWKPRATCCPNTSAIKSISETSGFHTRSFHMFCGWPIYIQLSKQGSTPTPWARGLQDQIQRRRARDRKPFMHRVCSAQRGIETMVSDHGLGNG